MKKLFSTISISGSAFLIIFFSATPALAASGSVTCQMQTGDVGTISASGSQIDAEKTVWKECAVRRLQLHEAARGAASLDDGDRIAESCINADISCK